MQDVPGLDVNASPFERLRKFAGMIVSVPKKEADIEIKRLRGSRRISGVKNGNRKTNNEAES